MPIACCIAGGGPAGMMLGYLLARAGIEVTVLEKHADFLRDFRGDTIHPSTLEVLGELDLLDAFLKLPHQKVRELRGWVGDNQITIADFSHLPARCPYIAFMPQWDFLNFMAKEAKEHSIFHLRMETEVIAVRQKSGRVVGLTVKSPQGVEQLDTDLVIAADGRHSIVREQANLPVKHFGVPFDVFWIRLSRRSADPDQTFGRFDRGKGLAMLNRQEYWQCGYVIPKGDAEHLKAGGLEALRANIAEIAPFLADRVQEIRTWDDVRLLTVLVDRLKKWHMPGLLCIGDAAHAMSPVGGVGINLAIQDAVAAANILIPALKSGKVGEKELARVQKRRTFPTVMTQLLQLFVQKFVIGAAIGKPGKITNLPWPLRLIRRFPFLTRIPARIVGLGFRPEHIQN